MSLGRRLEAFALCAISAEAPTAVERAVRGLLCVGSAAYGGVVRARNAGYNIGLFRARRLPCRVVCVGNLTAGGTGKTPTVMALAAACRAAGETVCILLRGYGRRSRGVKVVSEGGEPVLGWQEAGDEAVLLARRLPGVPVVVGEDRFAAGRLAVERFRPQLILLDDGFQHRRLYREADLVLLDATDPFGGGCLLPRGRLREPLGGLHRARAFLLTRADQGRDVEGLRRRVERVAPGRPIACGVLRLRRLRDLTGGRERAATEIRGKRVLAVCGIGNPDSFHRTVTETGAVVAGSLVFRDHHAFTDADLGRMAEAARTNHAEWIVTTDKDAVRLAGPLPFGCPVVVLEVVLEIVEGAEALAAALGIPGWARRG